MLSPGIYYPDTMTMRLMKDAAAAKIVKDQLANLKVNVFTGKTFDEEAASAGDFDMASMISIDEAAIGAAFRLDSSAMKIDFANMIDPNSLMSGLPDMPQPDLAAIASQIELGVTNDEIAGLMADVMSDYPAYCTNNSLDPTDVANSLPIYLASPEAQNLLSTGLAAIVDTDAIEAQVQTAMQSYMQTVMQTYMSTMMANMQKQIAMGMEKAMGDLSKNMASAMGIDKDAFAKAFQFNLTETELQQLMMSFLGGEESSSDGNLRKLGYANPDKPSSISIFPIDFEGKEKVIGILDDYNERMEKSGKEDEVITFTDIVGTLMTSVTDIINKITAILIAFVAISLVVSSIMIGIITYISVLERKKEIGILRSIGASKRDISNVFNAETLIVGFVAGLIGIVFTVLLTIPVNIIVHDNFNVSNIAILPVSAGVILVVVSMILSFIAGLIPSSAASRKDPVEALRSE
jgi:hypothetical protein